MKESIITPEQEVREIAKEIVKELMDRGMGYQYWTAVEAVERILLSYQPPQERRP